MIFQAMKLLVKGLAVNRSHQACRTLRAALRAEGHPVSDLPCLHLSITMAQLLHVQLGSVPSFLVSLGWVVASLSLNIIWGYIFIITFLHIIFPVENLIAT